LVFNLLTPRILRVPACPAIPSSSPSPAAKIFNLLPSPEIISFRDDFARLRQNQISRLVRRSQAKGLGHTSPAAEPWVIVPQSFGRRLKACLIEFGGGFTALPYLADLQSADASNRPAFPLAR
jgi:hypothetical protein